jgi:GNAT superfamily N-acetyltransferase
MSTIRALTPQDRTAWEPLWKAYQVFYEVDIPVETTDITWGRFHDASEPMHALGAFDDDGRLVGIVHVIFHRSCWLPKWTCYLQDLYVENSQRGKGTGAALIEAVADLAREEGAGRLYRLTHESNAQERRL